MPELSLSVQKDVVRHPHTWDVHPPHDGPCPICDGGLALCKVCGALEGALLDSCPGVRLTAEQHEWNYKKFLTFRGDGPPQWRLLRTWARGR